MTYNSPTPWSAEYDEYLRDESRHIGSAASISFPRTETDIIDIIHAVETSGDTITIQGARTGITAGAVPNGGHALNLSRMNSIGEIFYDDKTGEPGICVQPGALLMDIQKAFGDSGLFFPPDPTETTASIGGMTACNASGALTYSYGSTRDWVKRIRIILADGDVLSLKRGDNKARGRDFSLRTEKGRNIHGRLPSYTMPAVKSAAGYYIADNMDIIDLFIGMEGTLGIVSEVELKLIRKPRVTAGLVIFFPDEEAALHFVRTVRGENIGELKFPSSKPAAIEFFDNDSLNLLRNMKLNNPAFSDIPTLKPHFHTAVYTEFHSDSQDEMDKTLMLIMDVMLELGTSDENAWYATTDRETENLKSFRHAVPEAVNLLIDERRREIPNLTKLGTDMSVPDAELADTMSMYRQELNKYGLESVIFGHIGCNHVHVNILPRTTDEYEIGKNLYTSWAKKITALGGSVSAEHGIGKIKTPFLRIMYGDKGIAEMKALKTFFDPKGLLNPGNLF